jgi:uncharacterized protein YyaL (SSP411 family)
LAELTGRENYRDIAEKIINASLGLQKKYPSSFAYMLLAREFIESQPVEIAVIGRKDSVRRLVVVDSGASPEWQ